MGQDHKQDVLNDTKEKINRDSQLFDHLNVGDLFSALPGPLSWLCTELAIASICPSSQNPVSNLPLANYDPYSSRRFSQELLLTS